jgi:hybrid cluster-associated redox disulfide protein
VVPVLNITADSNVDELMTRHPEVVSVFMDRRMHCPGCLAARFETLSEVCRIYRIPLQPLLHELSSLTSGRSGQRQ